MPFRHIEHLCNKAGKSIAEFSDLQLKEMLHCGGKSVRKPAQSEELAEFLGILSGDGCIVDREYSINITCDYILDKNYVVSEVEPLFTSLFWVAPKIRRLKNEICCRVYSKDLFNFLSVACSFPVGEKKNRLEIPAWVLCNKKFSSAFLRGVFDTDGGFHRHHKNCAQIEYTSHSPRFLAQIYSALKDLNLNPHLGKEQVWILQKEKIAQFFEVINPRNKKHQYKYRKFRETGRVPLSREIKCGYRDSNPGHDLFAAI